MLCVHVCAFLRFLSHVGWCVLVLCVFLAVSFWVGTVDFGVEVDCGVSVERGGLLRFCEGGDWPCGVAGGQATPRSVGEVAAGG